jgi:hypothetical protein
VEGRGMGEGERYFSSVGFFLDTTYSFWILTLLLTWGIGKERRGEANRRVVLSECKDKGK